MLPSVCGKSISWPKDLMVEIKISYKYTDNVFKVRYIPFVVSMDVGDAVTRFCVHFLVVSDIDSLQIILDNIKTKLSYDP